MNTGFPRLRTPRRSDGEHSQSAATCEKRPRSRTRSPPRARAARSGLRIDDDESVFVGMVGGAAGWVVDMVGVADTTMVVEGSDLCERVREREGSVMHSR